MFLPEKIKEAREKAEFSQEKLMVALSNSGLSISRATISSWENGETKPNAEELATLAEFFELPITYFFTLKHSRAS